MNMETKLQSPYFLKTDIETKTVEQFRNKHPELFKDNVHDLCNNRYQFDWLNFTSYLQNWHCLDYNTRHTLTQIINSDFVTNCFRDGMKQSDCFEKHLLLLTGSAIWEIKPGRKTNMVLSNLKHSMLYCRSSVGSRLIDAKTCHRYAKKIQKKLDLKEAFKHFDAQIIVFESDESYRSFQNLELGLRVRIRKFFQENVECLRKMQKKGNLCSYIYSHEISCDSILNMRFRPHTHAVIFFPKGLNPPDLGNCSNFNDREIKVMPEIHRQEGTLFRFITYMLKAYSLVPVYEREFDSQKIQLLNTQTRQAWQAMIEAAECTAGERSYKRHGYSRIPIKEKKLNHGKIHRKRKYRVCRSRYQNVPVAK
jgi:hypothetical protein